MARTVDTKDFTFNRRVSNFEHIAATVSDESPDNPRVSAERMDPFTGSVQNHRSVNAGNAFAAAHGLGPADQSLLTMALDHVQLVAPVLGFPPSERVEFVPDPHGKKTSTGERLETAPNFVATPSTSFDAWSITTNSSESR